MRQRALRSVRRCAHAFHEGEPVRVIERIHGANGHRCFVDGQMFTGSRTEWKKEASVPGLDVYGEVYGRVQDLRYGRPGVRILVFDLLSPEGVWTDPEKA